MLVLDSYSKAVKYLMLVSFLLLSSFDKASAAVLIESRNLVIRTLHLIEDRDSISKVIAMSELPDVKEGLIHGFTRLDFFAGDYNIDKIKFKSMHGSNSILISFGVFHNGVLIGGAQIQSFHTQKMSSYLHREGLVEASDRPWFEQGLFIFPEFQGRGFGSEVTDARLAFIFNELGAAGVIATPLHSNLRSRNNSFQRGFREAPTENYLPFAERNLDLSMLYITRDMYYNLSCKRILR